MVSFVVIDKCLRQSDQLSWHNCSITGQCMMTMVRESQEQYIKLYFNMKKIAKAIVDGDATVERSRMRWRKLCERCERRDCRQAAGLRSCISVFEACPSES